MGFPSPATDYAASALTIDKLCQIDGNSIVIETTKGYAVIDRSRKPKNGDVVLITLFDQLHFAKIVANGLVTDDGQKLTGDELDGIGVDGVVTFTILRAFDPEASGGKGKTA
ncbi:TPA: hypothetical protein MC769_003176 [Klebsiella aerogenes]|nr:hypothetical protein [Klebsiella aerogenes]